MRTVYRQKFQPVFIPWSSGVAHSLLGICLTFWSSTKNWSIGISNSILLFLCEIVKQHVLSQLRTFLNQFFNKTINLQQQLRWTILNQITYISLLPWLPVFHLSFERVWEVMGRILRNLPHSLLHALQDTLQQPHTSERNISSVVIYAPTKTNFRFCTKNVFSSINE